MNLVVGEIVSTSYGTGPYVINSVSELCACPSYIDTINGDVLKDAEPHYHLRCTSVVSGANSFFYLNGFMDDGKNVWDDDFLIFNGSAKNIQLGLFS